MKLQWPKGVGRPGPAADPNRDVRVRSRRGLPGTANTRPEPTRVRARAHGRCTRPHVVCPPRCGRRPTVPPPTRRRAAGRPRAGQRSAAPCPGPGARCRAARTRKGRAPGRHSPAGPRATGGADLVSRPGDRLRRDRQGAYLRPGRCGAGGARAVPRTGRPRCRQRAARRAVPGRGTPGRPARVPTYGCPTASVGGVGRARRGRRRSGPAGRVPPAGRRGVDGQGTFAPCPGPGAGCRTAGWPGPAHAAPRATSPRRAPAAEPLALGSGRDHPRALAQREGRSWSSGPESAVGGTGRACMSGRAAGSWRAGRDRPVPPDRAPCCRPQATLACRARTRAAPGRPARVPVCGCPTASGWSQPCGPGAAVGGGSWRAGSGGRCRGRWPVRVPGGSGAGDHGVSPCRRGAAARVSGRAVR